MCAYNNHFQRNWGNEKMQHKTKMYTTAIMAFLTLLLVLASITATAVAAGAITLTPTTQGPGSAVTVDGTGFGATKAVGIGFGAEVAGSDTDMAYSGTGMGPYAGRVSNWPIKPGSFVLTSDTSSGGGGGIISTYTDAGDGTTIWSYDGTVMGTIDYVTGNWSRTTTVDVTGIAANYSATYTRYQYNVTPAAGVTTLGSGAFTASITVPSVADGSYTVTAVDTQGNKATATLVVDHNIPEGLTVGVMVALSSVAVVVGTRYFKKPKIKSYKPV
jgi:hypothetical protein